MMRTKKRQGAMVLLLLGAVILLMTNQASAQHGCTTGGTTGYDAWFQTNLGAKYNPNAPGTKIAGTLTLYYSPTGVSGLCQDGLSREELKDFVFTLSAITSNAQYTTAAGQYMPFSGIEHNVCFGADLDYQTGKVVAFLDGVVKSMIPASTVWYVKSISNVIEPPENDTNGCCSNVEFMMMDIVLAAK